jgi:hypothetical protein
MSRSWGRQFEFDMFEIDVSNKSRILRMDFWEAIDQAMYKQPNHWDPLHPHTVMGADLLESVKAILKQDLTGYCSNWYQEFILSNTGLYVALGTSADIWHQTDAIICCDLGYTAPIVTIDLKVVDHGEGFLRENHVIITPDHFDEIDIRGRKRIHNVAGIIAESLIFQLQQLGAISAPRSFGAKAS